MAGTPCPWAIQTPSPSSFHDVMSEELALQLHQQELHQPTASSPRTPAVATLSPPITPAVSSSPLSDDASELDSDRLLAEMLQAEYDQEYDSELSKVENKLNGVSKVSISFSNYRKSHPSTTLSSDDDEGESDGDDVSDHDGQVMPKKGYVGEGKNITTKHDPNICGRRNASRVMKFPPGFATGNGEDFDMKLSNQVYNVLKVHSHHEDKRQARTKDKSSRAVTDLALDPSTRLILYKLVNRGLLEEVDGCVSTGKEALVLHAAGGRLEDRVIPSECALKVFKTTLNEFKTREKYIRGDYHRFPAHISRQNPRTFIKLWAEKEMHNLIRMKRLGVPCPEVIALKKHVLVMSFLGQDKVAAPKLKDAPLNPDQLQDAYDQTVQIMKTLYKGQLVHADLSEYNILWYQNQVYIIDVSQSVTPQHQHAHEFLLRDCDNIIQFFSKTLSQLPTPPQLFNDITGLNLKGDGQELLAQIQDFEKNQDMVTHGVTETGKSYNFDYLFEKSMSERKDKDKDESSDSDDNDNDSEEINKR